MSDLFDNALDSLNVGIRFYLHEKFKTKNKHAILNIFHSVELFLKDCLSSIHPALIFQNIDKPIESGSYTVGFKHLIPRLRNFKIPISSEDEKTLKGLQKIRNLIEHHRFEDNETNELVIGKALKFLYYFLLSHFDKSLEELLTEEVYSKVWELILGYEERLAEAKKAVEQYLGTDHDTIISFCPECGNETIVIASEKGDFCFFCRNQFDMRQCGYCGEYFEQSELEENLVCSRCYSEITGIRPWE